MKDFFWKSEEWMKEVRRREAEFEAVQKRIERQ